jgi:3-oxoacyl-[acyl-carrier protein] reductase
MNILITGGTDGLGECLAKIFARDKKNIIIATGTSKSKIKKLVGLKDLASVTFIKCDFGNLSELKELVHLVNLKFNKKLDILINNAGIAYHGKISEIVPHELDEVIAVNTLAPMYLTSKLIGSMKRGARIINVSSYLGSKGKIYTATYTASKHALNGFSKVLRAEFAKKGIGVVQIEPGPMQTSFNKRTNNKDMKAQFNISPSYRIPAEIVASYIEFVVKTDPNVCPELIRIMPTEMSSE